MMDDISKCPVMHGSTTMNKGESTTNRDWWPNQLNISILHQNDKRSNPMSPDFNYRNEFKKLDYFASSETPFFLAVCFFRPHTPFVAPKEYFDFYDRKKIEIPEVSNEYLATLPEPAVKSIRAKKNQLNLEKELAQEIKEAYYSTITFVDAQVGRILDHLKSLGLDKKNGIIRFPETEFTFFLKLTLKNSKFPVCQKVFGSICLGAL